MLRILDVSRYRWLVRMRLSPCPVAGHLRDSSGAILRAIRLCSGSAGASLSGRVERVQPIGPQVTGTFLDVHCMGVQVKGGYRT